ncbi:MAG: hypothetical protein ACRD8O_00830 [Bryobacteraceae bacterium]
MPEPVAFFFALAILYSLFLIEGLLVLLALSRKKFALGSSLERRLEAPVRWLTLRPARAVIFIGCLAFFGRGVLLPFLPERQPMITDEFSYLLGADTFAAGRLANPPHPMWQHFETMHVLQQPTYSSMYQPSQGLILAAAKVAGGHPWIGVWLTASLMCACICWMLQGWLPPRWALLGGLLVVMRLGLFSYWMNSYWGGAAAATGGALLLGALVRLRRRPSVPHAFLMGLGAAILSLSRPAEGFVLCLAAGIMLLPRLRGNVIRVALPVATVVLPAFAFMGLYFYRVTGSPFQVPQLVQRELYAITPLFLWESPKPEPVYRHKAMRDFYAGWEMADAWETRSALGLVRNALRKVISAWVFYLGPALTVPLVMLPRVVKDRRLKPLVWIGIVCLFGLSLNAWFYAHYAAPIVALLFALIVQAIRHLRALDRTTGRGRFLARAVPGICALMIGIRLTSGAAGFLPPPNWPMVWYHTSPGNTERARVAGELSRRDGLHLAMVRYGPDHQPVMNEWVFNDAGIDASKIVWAREMDPANNAGLLRYYSNRHAWLVEADRVPARVTPYPR